MVRYGYDVWVYLVKCGVYDECVEVFGQAVYEKKSFSRLLRDRRNLLGKSLNICTIDGCAIVVVQMYGRAMFVVRAVLWCGMGVVWCGMGVGVVWYGCSVWGVFSKKWGVSNNNLYNKSLNLLLTTQPTYYNINTYKKSIL